jgi:hypothetical protein
VPGSNSLISVTVVACSELLLLPNSIFVYVAILPLFFIHVSIKIIIKSAVTIFAINVGVLFLAVKGRLLIQDREKPNALITNSVSSFACN